MYEQLHHGLCMSTNHTQNQRYTCTIDYVTGCACRLTSHQMRRYTCTIDSPRVVHVHSSHTRPNNIHVPSTATDCPCQLTTHQTRRYTCTIDYTTGSAFGLNSPMARSHFFHELVSPRWTRPDVGFLDRPMYLDNKFGS